MWSYLSQQGVICRQLFRGAEGDMKDIMLSEVPFGKWEGCSLLRVKAEER